MKDKNKHKYLVGYVGEHQCVYGKDFGNNLKKTSYTQPLTLYQAKLIMKKLSKVCTSPKRIYKLVEVTTPKPTHPTRGE